MAKADPGTVGNKGINKPSTRICRRRERGRRESRKATREKARGKEAHVWECGEYGHRQAECKHKGKGNGNWQKGKWGLNVLCGLQAVEKKSDGKEVPASSRSSTGVLALRPVLQVGGGAFAALQKEEEDEDEDEEEAPGFQSQASLYAEKEQKQKEHKEKEKDEKLLPPPPKPQSGKQKKQENKKGLYADERIRKEKRMRMQERSKRSTLFVRFEILPNKKNSGHCPTMSPKPPHRTK